MVEGACLPFGGIAKFTPELGYSLLVAVSVNFMYKTVRAPTKIGRYAAFMLLSRLFSGAIVFQLHGGVGQLSTAGMQQEDSLPPIRLIAICDHPSQVMALIIYEEDKGA